MSKRASSPSSSTRGTNQMSSTIKRLRSNLTDKDLEIDATISEDLDLTSSSKRQGVILRTWTEEHNPVNSLDQANFVVFQTKCYNNNLILPYQCYTKTQLKILNADGTDLEASEPVTLTNNISSGIWSNVGVQLNEYPMGGNDGLYGYRANLEKMINFPNHVQRNGLSICDYVFNDNVFEAIKTGLTFVVADHGKKPEHFLEEQRIKSTRLSKSNTYIDIIHHDLFNQTKYLPPETRLEVKFTKHEDNDFFLLSNQETNKYKVKVEKFTLFVQFAEVVPAFILSMKEMIEKEKNLFRIPTRQVNLSYHIKPSNQADFSQIANLLKTGNVLPRRLFIALVKQQAFYGRLTMDPYYYVDPGISNVRLRLGGNIEPLPEMTTVAEYVYAFQKTTGTLFSNNESPINVENWKKGKAIMAFDLTTGNSDDVFDVFERKMMELVWLLKDVDATNAYCMIVYSEHNGELRIDHDGKVEYAMLTPEG